MKTILAMLALLLSLSSMAGSGIGAVTSVLEQNEVEKLEESMNAKGFTLSKIVDVFATRGLAPRCPCNSMELTFSRVSGGKSEDKTFGVYTKGFGTSLEVTIQPVK